MGKDLFDRFPDVAATADRVLGYSIRELVSATRSASSVAPSSTAGAVHRQCAALQGAHRWRRAGAGLRRWPSLGEYNALLVAEAFDFETGLRLIQKRGALMGAISGGRMAAISGSTPAYPHGNGRVRSVHGRRRQLHLLTQTVLVHPPKISEALARISRRRRQGLPLNVRTAFHSRYMRAMAEQFAPSSSACVSRRWSCR